MVDITFIYFKVMIIGPPDTLYEGGFFKCHLLFPKEYPLKPPELRILTEIWHPNIDKNGKVCISILHEPGHLLKFYQFSDYIFEYLKVRTISSVRVEHISLLKNRISQLPSGMTKIDQ